MAQKKLERFAEIKSFPNVLEYPTGMQGNWNAHFGNDHPIILELACGKGEYTIGLAGLYPENNFIGVDIKGNRLWVGARNGIMQNLYNAAFLRSQIEMIDHYFANNEVSAIWLTFPDPQLRGKRARKRLTHPLFLRLYKKFLHPEGVIHLKTDSPDLYNFTKLVLDLYELPLVIDIDDVYSDIKIHKDLKIKTHYESLDIAQSKRVFYIAFKLTGILVDKDKILKQILNRHQNENRFNEPIKEF